MFLCTYRLHDSQYPEHQRAHQPIHQQEEWRRPTAKQKIWWKKKNWLRTKRVHSWATRVMFLRSAQHQELKCDLWYGLRSSTNFEAEHRRHRRNQCIKTLQKKLVHEHYRRSQCINTTEEVSTNIEEVINACSPLRRRLIKCPFDSVWLCEFTVAIFFSWWSHILKCARERFHPEIQYCEQKHICLVHSGIIIAYRKVWHPYNCNQK